MRPLLTPIGSARLALGSENVRVGSFPLDLTQVLRSSDLGEETLHLASELSDLAARDGRTRDRGRTLLFVLLFDALARGSTRLDTRKLRELARDLGLSRSDVHAVDAFARTLPRERPQLAFDLGGQSSSESALIASSEDAVLHWDGTFLSPRKWRIAEAELARQLLGRQIDAPDEAEIAAALSSLDKGSQVRLDPTQRSAVEHALRSAITVIVGGPGTGKTSTVAGVLRALHSLDPALEVALAAPTGKAADRMAHSLARALSKSEDSEGQNLWARVPRPRTLHRLLGYSPSERRFRHHAGSPLSARLVVVDEASMIDASMMFHLLAALRADAKLVLLGDADQLPSVEPGAVLADLVRAGSRGSIAVARLGVSHRMSAADPEGAHVLSVAENIRRGIAPELVGDSLVPGSIRALPRAPDSGDLPPGVSFLRDAHRQAFLTFFWRERIRIPGSLSERTYRLDDPEDQRTLESLFLRQTAARLLCVTRGRTAGADAINAQLGALAAEAERRVYSHRLSVGEPAIMTRNAYDESLWNGDQGLVLWVRSGPNERARPTFVVERGGSFVGHPLDRIGPWLERAYAITVHKAQGSEHDEVALLLSTEDIPRLMTREIVYTALTRARQRALVIGTPDVLRKAIGRGSDRATALAERLASA